MYSQFIMHGQKNIKLSYRSFIRLQKQWAAFYITFNT